MNFDDVGINPSLQIHPIRQLFFDHPLLLASLESTGISAQSIVDDYINNLEASELIQRDGESENTSMGARFIPFGTEWEIEPDRFYLSYHADLLPKFQRRR